MRAWIVVLVCACSGGSKKVTPPTQGSGTAAVAKPNDPPFTGKASELTGVVKKITVTGAAYRTQPDVEAALASAKDKPLDADRVRELLAKAAKIQGVADVAVDAVQLADGIELVVTVTPQPVLKKLTAIETGGKIVPLGMGGAPATGSAIEPHRIQALAGQLRDRYLSQGHFDAQVEWKRTDAADGVEVVIEVTPGVASTIGSVAFKGNTVPSKKLLEFTSKILVVGQPVLADKIEEAALEVTRHYWDIGYANVKIVSPAPVAGKNALVFTITENGVYRIGKITIKGVPAGDEAKYLKLFGAKSGDVFSRTKIAEGRLNVMEAYEKTGKLNVEVTPLTKVDLEKKTLDFTLEFTSSN